MNMSYCRFENTLNDLMDCYSNMDENDLSETEFRMRKYMVVLCKNIADEYSYLLEEEFEKDSE